MSSGTRFLRVLTFFMICSVSSGMAQKKNSFTPDEKLLKTIDKNFVDAAAQYKVMMKLLPPDAFPKTFENNKLETSPSKWWCSGFYPGTLLYIYEATKDKALLAEAERTLKMLEKEQYNTRTHDLGFMMFCSFDNANRLNPHKEYNDILVNSAKSLATRYNPKVECIRSWNSRHADDDFVVIIDNMMNLELLFWASKYIKDKSFYNIAVKHADKTMKHHFRKDYSSYHVVNYNSETGKVKVQKTHQGYSDESAWARGQAWALYGYTLMYRETKNKKYLKQAENIANYILNHPNMPKDKIPYWDFNAPDIPNAYRDASAATVMASAFLELCKYTNTKSGERYFKTAEEMINNLSSGKYKAAKGTNGGFILKHSVGHLPAKSEIDVPLTYADYYFVEAMKRYKEFN